MAHDHAILAAGDGKATALHRLHLAVARSSEIGAKDIGGGLQHSLFQSHGLDIGAWAPWSARLRQDGDGRVHAAGLHTEFAHGCFDQIRRAAGELDVHVWIGLDIDPDMQVKQMCVDGRRHFPGHRVVKNEAIVRRCPDRNSTTFAAALIEIVQQAFAMPIAPLLPIKRCV